MIVLVIIINFVVMKHTELQNKLYKECGLSMDDVFKSNHFTIITRSGIEKIQYNKNITVTFDAVCMTSDLIVVKAIGKMDNRVIETFGEWNITHAKHKKDMSLLPYYSVALAEKRALSRVVLKLMNLYENNVLGEDEEVFDTNLADDRTKDYIERLLSTSLFDESQKLQVEQSLFDLTQTESHNIIENLKANQQDPIKDKGNYTQSYIKESL